MLGVHRLEFGVKRLVEGIKIIEAVRNLEKTRGQEFVNVDDFRDPAVAGFVHGDGQRPQDAAAPGMQFVGLFKNADGLLEIPGNGKGVAPFLPKKRILPILADSFLVFGDGFIDFFLFCVQATQLAVGFGVFGVKRQRPVERFFRFIQFL